MSTTIGDLFKKPYLPGDKRKPGGLQNPDKPLKVAKISENNATQMNDPSTVGDESGYNDNDNDGEDIAAGPEMPIDYETGEADDDDEGGRFFGGGITAETAGALDFIEEQDQTDPVKLENINSAWLRKRALNFEKKISKNAELRAKYEDNPEKFMASEADLEVEIKALSILSEHPNLYEDFAKLGCVSSLVSLLSHENTDIAIDAIEIINELTDDDVQAEQAEWNALVDAMIDSDLLNLLHQILSCLNEEDDADRAGIYHVLGVFENLSSRASTAELIGEKTAIISWLLSRIQKSPKLINQNTQYAAEVLAILLQSSAANQGRLIELDGIDFIMQLLNRYSKRDPVKGSEEEEYVENLFNCLTCCVDDNAGKAKFLAGEGIELCIIMLRDGKWSRRRALRVLDHVLAGADTVACCEHLVNLGGLKTVFGLFLKKPTSFNMENLLGLLHSMLRSLPATSDARVRLLAKFVEKDYEKISLIVAHRSLVAENWASSKRKTRNEWEQLSLEEQEARGVEEWLTAQMGERNFSLEIIDVILAWLAAEDEGSRGKIQEDLLKRNETLETLKNSLQAQLHIMHEAGTDGSGGEAMVKEMLETLILCL